MVTSVGSSTSGSVAWYCQMLKVFINADLLTGADVNADKEDTDSDIGQTDESVSGDSMMAGDHALNEEEEQEDEDAASDDIATAKGNHKRREDKGLLPTEDK